MPRYCDGCGRRLSGICKKDCREASDTITFDSGFTMTFQRGDATTTQVPPLDGFISFNDDGSSITRHDERVYNEGVNVRGKEPVARRGPRPSGWYEALERIGERAAVHIKGGLPEC